MTQGHRQVSFVSGCGYSLSLHECRVVWMQHRVPHTRRYWRLVKELQEDGIVSESESEEEGSEDTHWGSEESDEEETDGSDSDGSFDDEKDWFVENLQFGSLPQ